MPRTHKLLNVRGVRIHAVEEGEGPLVVLLHGFPESWYSWRHQLTALAAAGFKAVAIDSAAMDARRNSASRRNIASASWSMTSPA